MLNIDYRSLFVTLKCLKKKNYDIKNRSYRVCAALSGNVLFLWNGNSVIKRKVCSLHTGIPVGQLTLSRKLFSKPISKLKLKL